MLNKLPDSMPDPTLPDTKICELVTAFEQGGRLQESDFQDLDIDAAFSVLAEATRGLTQRVGGWKLGASTFAARDSLGLDRIFAGPIPEQRIYASPARLALSDWSGSPIEAEVALRIDVDAWLGSSSDDPADHIRSVHPAFELPASRFATLGSAGTAGLVADFGAAGGAILGPGMDVSLLDGINAPDWVCRLSHNGEEVGRAALTVLRASPLALLGQLKRDFDAMASKATSDQIILIGGLVSSPPPIRPAIFEADVGPLGQVSVSFSD